MSDTAAAEAVAAIEVRARRFDTPCGDGTMAWRAWGEDRGGAAPLVLSHGAQGAWSHWIRNVEALAQSRMVIAADLPGHGDWALPASADHAGISAALSAGLRAIVGERPVDLAGFSFGGVAFAYFASLYPAQVRRLILIGCGGLDTPHGAVELRRVGGLQGAERRAAITANLLGLMLHHADAVDDIALYLQVFNGRRAKLANAADLVLPDKLKTVLPRVPVPVDAIWGAFDRPHPQPHLQEAVLRAVQPDTDFRVIADAGHWAMYERPDAFNAALLGMLDQPLRPLPDRERMT